MTLVSDRTIASVARLYNDNLDALSDAEVVQLVAEGRDAHWEPPLPRITGQWLYGKWRASGGYYWRELTPDVQRRWDQLAREIAQRT